MSAIDLNTLTPEERKRLIEQAKEFQKQEKEKKKADLKALESLAEESLPQSFELLKNASQALTQAKAQVFINFENYLKLKIEAMGIKARNQQSHTITYGKQSIKLGYRITDGYTDEAGYGLEMVHKFLGVKVYKEALDDLQARYEAKFREITGLYEDKIKLLQDEITILKRSIKQLKEENTRLKERLKENNLE